MPAQGITLNACCGCGVCSFVCAKNAVDISINKQGFYAANLKTDLCVRCEECKEVCPKNVSYKGDKEVNECEMYAAVTKDKRIHDISAGGGICTTLSLYGVRHGYKVVGAYYDIETHRVKHKIAYCEEEVKEFANSKYLQSECTSAFKAALSDKESKYIIVGTPCQISSIRKVLKKRKDEQRYLLIDFFCHGVPSYNLWDRYIEEHSRNQIITSVAFRDHIHDCDGMWMSMGIAGTEKAILERRNRSMFYRFFDDNVAMNTPCNSCQLSQFESCADIRVGDARGVNGYYSRIILITDRGKEYFNFVKDSFILENYDRKQIYSNKIDSRGEIRRKLALDSLEHGDSLKKASQKYYRTYSIREKLFITLNRMGVYPLLQRIRRKKK